MGGVEVLKMGDLKYLGSAIRSNGECRGEVKKRVQAEWFKASFRGDLWQKNSRKSNSEGLHDGSAAMYGLDSCDGFIGSDHKAEKYNGIDQMDNSG